MFKILSIITAHEASPKMLVEVLIISIILSIPNTSGRAITGTPAAAKTATTSSDGPGTPAVPTAPRTDVRTIATYSLGPRSTLSVK